MYYLHWFSIFYTRSGGKPVNRNLRYGPREQICKHPIFRDARQSDVHCSRIHSQVCCRTCWGHICRLLRLLLIKTLSLKPRPHLSTAFYILTRKKTATNNSKMANLRVSWGLAATRIDIVMLWIHIQSL